jgi:hypothetical protein
MLAGKKKNLIHAVNNGPSKHVYSIVPSPTIVASELPPWGNNDDFRLTPSRSDFVYYNCFILVLILIIYKITKIVFDLPQRELPLSR